MKVESCGAGVVFCHSACVVVLGTGRDIEDGRSGTMEGVHCGAEVHVECVWWLVLRSERARCVVLPPSRVADLMVKGGGKVGLLPHSGGVV